MPGQRQIQNDTLTPGDPPTFAWTPEAQQSRDATAQGRAAAQAAIDATQKAYPVGNYNTTPDVDTSPWLLSQPGTEVCK